MDVQSFRSLQTMTNTFLLVIFVARNCVLPFLPLYLKYLRLSVLEMGVIRGTQTWITMTFIFLGTVLARKLHSKNYKRGVVCVSVLITLATCVCFVYVPPLGAPFDVTHCKNGFFKNTGISDDRIMTFKANSTVSLYHNRPTNGNKPLKNINQSNFKLQNSVPYFKEMSNKRNITQTLLHHTVKKPSIPMFNEEESAEKIPVMHMLDTNTMITKSRVSSNHLAVTKLKKTKQHIINTNAHSEADTPETNKVLPPTTYPRLKDNDNKYTTGQYQMLTFPSESQYTTYIDDRDSPVTLLGSNEALLSKSNSMGISENVNRVNLLLKSTSVGNEHLKNTKNNHLNNNNIFQQENEHNKKLMSEYVKYNDVTGDTDKFINNILVDNSKSRKDLDFSFQTNIQKNKNSGRKFYRPRYHHIAFRKNIPVKQPEKEGYSDVFKKNPKDLQTIFHKTKDLEEKGYEQDGTNENNLQNMYKVRSLRNLIPIHHSGMVKPVIKLSDNQETKHVQQSEKHNQFMSRTLLSLKSPVLQSNNVTSNVNVPRSEVHILTLLDRMKGLHGSWSETFLTVLILVLIYELFSCMVKQCVVVFWRQQFVDEEECTGSEDMKPSTKLQVWCLSTWGIVCCPMLAALAMSSPCPYQLTFHPLFSAVILFVALILALFLLPIPGRKSINRFRKRKPSKPPYMTNMKQQRGMFHRMCFAFTSVITGFSNASCYEFIFWYTDNLQGFPYNYELLYCGYCAISSLVQIPVVQWIHQQSLTESTVNTEILSESDDDDDNAEDVHFSYKWWTRQKKEIGLKALHNPSIIIATGHLFLAIQLTLFPLFQSSWPVVLLSPLKGCSDGLLEPARSTYSWVFGYGLGCFVGALIVDMLGMSTLFWTAAGISFVWSLAYALHQGLISCTRRWPSWSYSHVHLLQEKTEEDEIGEQESEDWLERALQQEEYLQAKAAKL